MCTSKKALRRGLEVTNVVHHVAEGEPKGAGFSSASLGSPCSGEGSERCLPLCLSSWGHLAKWEPDISVCPTTLALSAGWMELPSHQAMWQGAGGSCASQLLSKERTDAFVGSSSRGSGFHGSSSIAKTEVRSAILGRRRPRGCGGSG